MSSSTLVRWSGLAAMLGGVLGVVLSPVLAHLWDTYSESYRTYGRLYFLSLPPELLGLYALRNLRGGGLGALERWGFRLLLVCAWLSVIGVFTDYWVTVPPGYWLVILGTLPLVAGLVLLSLAMRRVDAIPGWATFVMFGAGVGTVPVMFLVLFHVPSGPLLLQHAVWVVLGYLLLTGRVATVGQLSRVR